MKKILIIDDSPLIRKRIVELLMKSKDIRIAGEVGNGSDTIKWVERLKPDTVILDICLPDRNGISLLKTFKEHYPKIKVIMLTHLDDARYRSRCLRLGADVYLSKSDAFEKIVDAVIDRPAH